MPSAEQSLKTLLTTGSPNPVHAFVGQRVYALNLPQGVIYPAIRYQRISTARSQYRTLDGRAGYASPRMQVDCYAATPMQALEVAQAVYQLLEGFRGIVSGLRLDGIATEDERAEFEPAAVIGGANLPKHSLDFFFYHPES